MARLRLFNVSKLSTQLPSSLSSPFTCLEVTGTPPKKRKKEKLQGLSKTASSVGVCWHLLDGQSTTPFSPPSQFSRLTGTKR